MSRKKNKRKKRISLFGDLSTPPPQNRKKKGSKGYNTVDIGNIMKKKNNNFEIPDLQNTKPWFKKFYRLGSEEFERKSFEKSLAYFSHLCNSIEENPEAFQSVDPSFKKSLYIGIGLCLRNLGSILESVSYFDIAESITPRTGFEHAKGLQEKAVSLNLLGRREEAFVAFFEALEKSNGILSKTIESIWTLYREEEGDEEKGLSFLHDLTKKYPHQFYVYTLLGKHYSEIEYFNRAIDIFLKNRNVNRRIPQDYFITLWERARWYFKNKMYMKSLKDYKEILEFQNSSYIFYERGKVLEKVGEYEKALEDFRKCIGFKSEDASLYYHRGNCFFSIGNYERALKCYLHTEKRYLNNSSQAKARKFVLFFTIGKTLQLLQHNKRSLEYFFKALKERESNLDRKSDVFFEIGIIHEKMGLENEAISFFEQSLDVYKNYSRANYLNNDFATDLKNTNPKSPITPLTPPQGRKRDHFFSNQINILAARRLAVIYYRRKNFKKALFFFEKLTKIEPPDIISSPTPNISTNDTKKERKEEEEEEMEEEEEISEREVRYFSNKKNRKVLVTKVENLMNVGICLQKLRRYEEAIEAYEKFLREKKRLVRFFVKRAENQQKLEQEEIMMSHSINKMNNYQERSKMKTKDESDEEYNNNNNNNEEEEGKKLNDRGRNRRKKKNDYIVSIPSYIDPQEYFGNSKVHHMSTRLAKEHIAICLTFLNRFEESLELLNDVEKTVDGGLSEEGYYIRGKIFEKIGVERLMNEFVEKADRPEKVTEGYNMVMSAFSDFQMVIEKNPRKIDTYVHLGYLSRRMGMYPEVFIKSVSSFLEYQNRALKNFQTALFLLREEKELCMREFEKMEPERFRKVNNILVGSEKNKEREEEEVEEEEEEVVEEEEVEEELQEDGSITIHEKKLEKIRSKKNFIRGMIKRIRNIVKGRDSAEWKEIRKLYGSSVE